MTPEKRARLEACPHAVWIDCLPGFCSNCGASQDDLKELREMRKAGAVSKLNVYRVADGGETHWAIAENEHDASAMIVESRLCDAETVEEYLREYDPTFAVVEPTKPITLDIEGDKTTLTAAEWIEREGRGLLGSTVF